MDNLYLKEVEFRDLDLLSRFNKDFKNSSSYAHSYIEEEKFEDWLKSLKKSQEDNYKMHIFPYWLIKGEKAIGLPILKTNIEVDSEYKKYGGHISYFILPSYRMKGYGSKCLHLVLEQCKKIGLDTVLISCDERNIGSINVIENNYGILNNTCIINNEDQFKGRFFRRYLVDVNKSLMMYKQNVPKRKSTLKQICNLDRSNVKDFLINNMQSEVEEEILKFSKIVDDINNIEDVAKFYQIFIKNFKFEKTNEVERYKRFTKEIVKSRICFDSNDAGLVLSTILRLKGIPTIFVSSVNFTWIQNFQKNKKEIMPLQNYIFLEIYLNNKWHLFDLVSGKIYDNYDYNNLFLPNGYYAFRKILNNYNYGAYSLDDNNKIIEDAFKNFDLTEYEDPNYKFIDLKVIKTICV